MCFQVKCTFGSCGELLPVSWLQTLKFDFLVGLWLKRAATPLFHKHFGIEEKILVGCKGNWCRLGHWQFFVLLVGLGLKSQFFQIYRVYKGTLCGFTKIPCVHFCNVLWLVLDKYDKVQVVFWSSDSHLPNSSLWLNWLYKYLFTGREWEWYESRRTSLWLIPSHSLFFERYQLVMELTRHEWTVKFSQIKKSGNGTTELQLALDYLQQFLIHSWAKSFSTYWLVIRDDSGRIFPQIKRRNGVNWWGTQKRPSNTTLWFWDIC